VRYFFFEDFFEDDFFDEVFFDEEAFFDEAFFEDADLRDFVEVPFFEDDAFFDDEAFFDEDFLAGGTLPPAARASDNPIAIACLRLVTFLPDPPLFSVPRLRSCIVFSTFSEAFLPYLLAMHQPPAQFVVQAASPALRRCRSTIGV
jgi:hypothetical protein